MTTERWEDIPGCAGYQASSLGRIRSVDRRLPDGRLAAGVVLVLTEDDNGYLRVTLSLNGRPVTKLVHVLVCSAFHGPRPKRREVRHLDGVKVNCRPGNLAWGSKPQQEKDKKHHRRQKVSQVLLTRLGRM